MSLRTQIAELEEKAQEAHTKGREIRLECERSNQLKEGEKGKLEDSVISEKLEEVEKYYDERDAHLDAKKLLERELYGEESKQRHYLTHPLGHDAPVGWKGVAERAVKRFEEMKAAYDKAAKSQSVDGESNTPAPFAELEEDEQKELNRLRRLAFNKYLHINNQGNAVPLNHELVKARLSEVEVKALGTLSDADGGIAVFEEQGTELITKRRDARYIRAAARVLSTSGASLSFPSFTVSETIAKRAETEEATPKTVSDILAKTTFTPHKFMDIYKVPQELVEDQAFNLVGFLLDELRLEWDEQEEGLFLTGDGNGEPYGILDETVEALLAGANLPGGGVAIDEDDILDAVYGIKAVNRAGASWMMPRIGIKAVRKLQDGNGRYHWQDGLQAGQPARLAGYPVNESEFFPDNWTGGSAGDPLALFGDWFYGYWIVDRTGGMSITPLRELYAATDEIGYKYRTRVDGAPVRLEPWYSIRRGA